MCFACFKIVVPDEHEFLKCSMDIIYLAYFWIIMASYQKPKYFGKPVCFYVSFRIRKFFSHLNKIHLNLET